MRTMPNPRAAAPLCAAVLVLALGACGQKGALYHPEPAATPATRAEPARQDDERGATGSDHDRAPR